MAEPKIGFTVYEWDNEFKKYIRKRYDKDGILIPEAMKESSKKYWNSVLPSGGA